MARSMTSRGMGKSGGKEGATASRAATVAARYRGAIAAAILHAAGIFAQSARGPAGKRRIVNYLRGNQLPQEGGPRVDDVFGLLEGLDAGWIGEAVESLVDAGHLRAEPRSGSLPPSISLGEASGAAPPEELPVEALPRGPRLGSNPELEGKLRSLRRELARAEGRAAYGVFPNAALAALAEKRPSSMEELASVPGFGEARLRKYGRRILSSLSEAGRKARRARPRP